jgi:hypothetical protein
MVDVDRDGDLDLATANYHSHDVAVLRNLGNGAFAPQAVFSAGSYPLDLTAADFDGDQWPDLAVADRDGNAVRLLTNNRSGAFPTASAVNAGAGPTRIQSGDFNTDLRPDLVVLRAASRQIAVLLGTDSAAPPPPPPPPPPPSASIVLSVAGTTTRPLRKVDLRWNGATGPSVTLRRNGSAIQTANDGQFTNTVPARGTYRYRVCQPSPVLCSNEVTVRFDN